MRHLFWLNLYITRNNDAFFLPNMKICTASFARLFIFVRSVLGVIFFPRINNHDNVGSVWNMFNILFLAAVPTVSRPPFRKSAQQILSRRFFSFSAMH